MGLEKRKCSSLEVVIYLQFLSEDYVQLLPTFYGEIDPSAAANKRSSSKFKSKKDFQGNLCRGINANSHP